MSRQFKTVVFTNKKHSTNVQTPRRQPRRSRSVGRNTHRSRSRSRSRSRTPHRKQIKYGPIDGFLHRLWIKLSHVFFDPYTYLGMIIFSLLIYIHHFHVDDSAVNSFLKTIKKNDSLKPFAEWFESNINKFFALIMVLYHSLQISPKYRYLSTLIFVLLVLLLPNLSITTYSMALFGSIIYHKLKKKTDKFLIISLYLLATLWLYYEDIMKYHNKNTTTTTRPRRDADAEAEA